MARLVGAASRAYPRTAERMESGFQPFDYRRMADRVSRELVRM